MRNGVERVALPKKERHPFPLPPALDGARHARETRVLDASLDPGEFFRLRRVALLVQSLVVWFVAWP